jgi:hypothetical protein
MFDDRSIKNHVSKNLPNLELFYDKIIHNKVHSDMYLLIPKGNNVLLWFTRISNVNKCILIYLNKYNLVSSVEDIHLSYNKELSYGTILYGTVFLLDKIRHMTCEDIYFYKGNIINHNLKNIYERLESIKFIFDKELNRKLLTNKSIVLGLPIIDNKIGNCFNSIKNLNYQIKGIRIFNCNSYKSHGFFLNKFQEQKECVFKVKASIEEDVYTIFSRNGEYGNLLIQNYKTSVMMNNLFRNIRENKNLDLLEMSDSEEEFENIDPNKFVDLEKTLYMNCRFIKKFRKWIPLAIADKGLKILSYREIKNLESC